MLVSDTDQEDDQRWLTSVSPSSMTMPTASSWIEHYFPNYTSGAPHTPFSPPSHGELTTCSVAPRTFTPPPGQSPRRTVIFR